MTQPSVKRKRGRTPSGNKDLREKMNTSGRGKKKQNKNGKNDNIVYDYSAELTLDDTSFLQTFNEDSMFVIPISLSPRGPVPYHEAAQFQAYLRKIKEVLDQNGLIREGTDYKKYIQIIITDTLQEKNFYMDYFTGNHPSLIAKYPNDESQRLLAGLRKLKSLQNSTEQQTHTQFHEDKAWLGKAREVAIAEGNEWLTLSVMKIVEIFPDLSLNAVRSCIKKWQDFETELNQCETEFETFLKTLSSTNFQEKPDQRERKGKQKKSPLAPFEAAVRELKSERLRIEMGQMRDRIREALQTKKPTGEAPHQSRIHKEEKGKERKGKQKESAEVNELAGIYAKAKGAQVEQYGRREAMFSWYLSKKMFPKKQIFHVYPTPLNAPMNHVLTGLEKEKFVNVGVKLTAIPREGEGCESGDNSDDEYDWEEQQEAKVTCTEVMLGLRLKQEGLALQQRQVAIQAEAIKAEQEAYFEILQLFDEGKINLQQKAAMLGQLSSNNPLNAAVQPSSSRVPPLAYNNGLASNSSSSFWNGGGKRKSPRNRRGAGATNVVSFSEHNNGTAAGSSAPTEERNLRESGGGRRGRKRFVSRGGGT